MPTRLNAAVAERQKAAQYHDQGLFRHCIQSDSVRHILRIAGQDSLDDALRLNHCAHSLIRLTGTL